MLNYIKAECFKTFNRVYTRNTLLIFALLAALVNVVFFMAFRSNPADSQELIRTSLSVIVPMLLIMVYMVLIMIILCFLRSTNTKPLKTRCPLASREPRSILESSRSPSS